jgi:hypothetical protein
MGGGAGIAPELFGGGLWAIVRAKAAFLRRFGAFLGQSSGVLGGPRLKKMLFFVILERRNIILVL